MLLQVILTDAFSLRGPAVLVETRHISPIQELHPLPRFSQGTPVFEASVSDVQEVSAADDAPPENSNGNNIEEEEIKTATMSKAKWKKKRYLMMQDVMNLIKKGDSQAPKKAEETLARMLKLGEIHQDAGFLPNEQVYNVRQAMSTVGSFLEFPLPNFIPPSVIDVDQCDCQMF